LNDAESQGTFWVDLPDFSSSTSDIQIQRGIGTSTNGAGAFGASINLNTLNSNNSLLPYAEVSNSYGSFNTFKHTFKLGTGLIDGKWNVEGRLSKLTSDGYIDRATSDLSSYYISGGYMGDRSMLKAIAFSGHEQTYQAWYGVPLSFMDSARTYNPYTYDNEVDNYKQDHYQLHYVFNASPKLKINTALHYTRGNGYYEQYKSDESLNDYGIDPISFSSPGDTILFLIPFIGDTLFYDVLGDTTIEITQTDLIRRRWLDNHFYGAVFSAEYQTKKLKLVIGGGANQYRGRHYGEVIWSEFASNSTIRHPYYDNDATKNDIHAYVKAYYDVNDKIGLFADLQQRMVQYDFLGYDNNLVNIQQTADLSFFNPKAGINFQINDAHGVYGFVGIGNKEPNRNDYTNSTPQSRPLHEQMTDIELGYRFQSKSVFAHLNLYNMDYRNQLIISGELNDVGAAIRTNVSDSYRRGIELSTGIKLLKNLELRANATISQNKIAEFHEFKDDWDTEGQIDSVFTNTDIAFSPNIIIGSQLIYQPIKSDKYGDVEMAFITKYVGDQYIDNTSNRYALLYAYTVHDLRINYTLKNKCFKELVLSGWIRNLLNKEYISNAWIYKFRSAGYDPRSDDPYANAEGQGMYNMIGAFPQAGRHFFLGLTLKF
jgi:iron complex outermembrane receptor protein